MCSTSNSSSDTSRSREGKTATPAVAQPTVAATMKQQLRPINHRGRSDKNYQPRQHLQGSVAGAPAVSEPPVTAAAAATPVATTVTATGKTQRWSEHSNCCNSSKSRGAVRTLTPDPPTHTPSELHTHTHIYFPHSIIHIHSHENTRVSIQYQIYKPDTKSSQYL